MNKQAIIEALEEMATLMELQGENPFAINAHRNAARRLESLGEDFDERVKQGRMQELSGIGPALATKIETLYREGELPALDELRAAVPDGLIQMLRIPGLGAKKVRALYLDLGIEGLAELKKACEEGKVSGLKGFAKKTESNILNGLENLERYDRRLLWIDARAVAEPILAALKRVKGVTKVELAGSLRRCLETVGDIDVLVAAEDPEPVMEALLGLSEVGRVLAHGSSKSSIRLTGGFQVDLRVVPPAQFAFALHYFTGSKAHNIKVRGRARERGLSLNEYGFEAIRREVKIPRVRTEKELFGALGLEYIPPELREDLGEVEWAESKPLPRLIQLEDLRGAFHNHTTESDGLNTLQEMALAAQDLGWDYLGISDHSKSSVQANGLDEERLLVQIEAVRKLNRSRKTKIHIFSGVECDILSEGQLDLADEALAELDYVVVSVHRGFSLDEEAMTKRLIRAIEHPATTMVGHLTGRLLLKREPYSLNIPKVIDAAIANGVIIELNAHPMRLDMDWRWWHRAVEKGLLCSLNPDAHSVEGLEMVRAGINVARKGWLQKDQVLNTWSLDKVKKYLKRKS